MVTILLDDVSEKLVSGQKTAFLTQKKATLDNRDHKTARQAAERPPTGKPKESREWGQLSLKKGLYGCSVKADFWAKNGSKMQLVGPKSIF